MHIIQVKRIYPFFVMMLIAGVLSLPATAGELEKTVLTGKPVIPDLIKRIVTDPDRTFKDVSGMDECSYEKLYLDTMDILKQYADSPEKNSEPLKFYILSDQAQCNCADAIVGKDMDDLLEYLGSSMSDAPCN